jgi:vacuolar protein sorting-associated protein 35
MEEDQEKYVDDAMKIIKAQAFHMHKTIEDNQLRQCLKETSIMLGELKTSLLTPRYYYQIYTTIFDDMQYLEQYFKEEYRRGRKLKYLYDSVQQANSIIPRLYLLITVGSVYIESQTVPAGEIIFDLLQMVKGVQNPLRGLFLRYYLLKMIKDKLPDKDNEYEQTGSKFEDTLKFILQNLDEMNRLWIRLSVGCTGNERLIREKERNELKILVGENIVRLASLNGLTLEIYRDEVLPKIINILLESKDQLSQQYLMECIIHAFPDDYNIHCMGTILDTCTSLVPTVDIKQLFINLMDKLAKFVGDKDQTGVFESAEKIFDLLQKNIDKIIEENTGIDTLKLIELLTAFIKFALKCSPNKLAVVNHSLGSSVNILAKSKSDTKHSQESIKLIGRLLSAPLESTLSIFDMPSFAVLMTYLDYPLRSTLALRIIESLISSEKGQQETVLNSSERVNILLDFIRPLLIDTSDTVESDLYQFEYEQQAVTKLIFIIFNNDPIKLFEMYNILLGVFLKGGIRRIKFTLPAMVNAYIIFCSMVCYGYDAKLNDTQKTTNKPIHEEFINKLQPKFENSNEYIKLLINTYTTVNDIITNISNTYQELAFKLYLSVITQVNEIKVERHSFEEISNNFTKSALALYKSISMDENDKVHLLTLYIATITRLNILNNEDMGKIKASIIKESGKEFLTKPSNQCIALLNCSHLYEATKEVNLIENCLNKATKLAVGSSVVPKNWNLLVLVLNKYLYYIEKGILTALNIDNFNNIIDTFRFQVDAIRGESNLDNTYTAIILEIERYFNNSIKFMNRLRATHDILQEVDISEMTAETQ